MIFWTGIFIGFVCGGFAANAALRTKMEAELETKMKLLEAAIQAWAQKPRT